MSRLYLLNYQPTFDTSGVKKSHKSRGKKTRRKKQGKSGKGSQPLTTKPDADHDSVGVTVKDHDADKTSYSSYAGVKFGGNILNAGGTVFAKGRPLDGLSIDRRAYDHISSSSQTNSVIPRQRIPQGLFHLAQILNDEPKDPARLLLTGNAIPDLLFNQKPNDFDCLVNADLDELNDFLQSQDYATDKINAKHYPLLQVYILDDKGLPTTVGMGYLKREPHQSLEDAIQDNMANRDFAISALYADITEACRQGDVQPIDVIGGEGFKALQKRQITMHETNGLTAEDQLRQDPTRLLRLANLLIKYSGRMVLSDEIQSAVSQPRLQWLPQTGPILITDDVVLLGQDSWADARYGDYDHSLMAMNDSRLIEDLSSARAQGSQSLKAAMQRLADEDAQTLDGDIQRALADYNPSQVIVTTHVPPFKEACFHRGQSTGDDVIPFYTSKATGDVLLKAAKNNPLIGFNVLCGHTHGQAFYQPVDNLQVNVGGVSYGDPQIQAIWCV